MAVCSNVRRSRLAAITPILESIRVPIAAWGAAIIAFIVVVAPADHTLLSIAMAGSTPLVFAFGALSVDADLWDHVGPPSWERRVPRLRRIAFIAFILVVLVLPIAVIPFGRSGGSSSGQEEGSDGETASAGERWADAGYGAVAPRVVDYDEMYTVTGYPREGFVVGHVPDDRVDWDDWRALRFEVWRATASVINDPRGSLLGTSPMGVVPVDDPWAGTDVVVRVGYPGAEGFLVFPCR